MRHRSTTLHGVLLATTMVVTMIGAAGVALVVPDAPTAVAASEISCSAPSGPPAATNASGGFVGRQPLRLADTRSGDAVPAGCWLRVRLPSSVPSNATAVAITVTSDRVQDPGFLTVHGCGSALPDLSNLNIRTEGPNSNFAVIGVDATREVCVYSSVDTDAIVDLVGHFAPGGAPFQELEPRRVFDSRDPNRRTPDVTGPMRDRQIVTIDRARLGVPPTTSAVMVNLTVADAEDPGFMTAFPCAPTKPATSNVNFERREDRANTSIVALSATGTMCLELEQSSANVIVDLVGFFGGENGLEFQSGTSRLADSRNGVAGWTGPFAANETRSFDPGRTRRLPDGSRVAVLGVISTRSEAQGFLQVRPCGSTADVSSVNYSPGVDITNLVVVPIDDGGTVCVTASAPTDVVVDLFGGFGTDGLMRSLSVGPHEVFPSFRPDVHDYVAYCPSTTGNSFDVTARGMPNTTVSLIGGPSGTTRLSTRATRDADQAIALRVAPSGGVAEEYWIRCLPPDFPRVSVTRTGDTEPGYYLLNNGTATAAFGIIVDSNGVPVWYKRGLPNREPRGLQLLENGDLTWFQSAGFAFGIDTKNVFERFGLDGAVRQTYSIQNGSDATNHHELVPLPNGNFLLTSMPLRDPVVDTSCWVQDLTQPSGYRQETADKIAGAIVQEVDANNQVVRTWDADVLAQDNEKVQASRITLDEMTVPLCFRTTSGQYYLSGIHPNGLAVSGPAGSGGLVLISARHHDAVYAVDFWGTDNVVWKLGGTNRFDGTRLQALGQQPTTPARQHDVQVLPNGRVTMFDNRTPLPFPSPSGGGAARYVEYEITGTSSRVMSQVARENGQSSGALGSARLQSDGSVVINWGAVPGPTFTEVDASGATRFEVGFQGTRFSYRTLKVPVDALDIATLRATAGGTLTP